MADSTKKDQLQRRLGAMKQERSSFDDHYKSLAEFVSPRRGRFFNSERNRGERSFWNKIINGRATWALRTATAGMFNGIMSPSRPWVILETDDSSLSEFGPVKDWFYVVQEQMRRIFNDSNLYNMAPMKLRELLLFGTGCMSHVDDDEHLARFYAHTVGSYYISQDDTFRVDTVAREFERTTRQLVKEFGLARVSTFVKSCYDRGDYETWHPVAHFTMPNEDYRPGVLGPEGRRWVSCYYEPGNNDKDALLRQSGFDEFPYYVPRWETANEDVYGTDCPGMTALGDVRQLQTMEKLKAQGLHKVVNPPLHGPAALKNQSVSALPGGSTFYDAPTAQNVLKPVYEVRLPLQEMREDMGQVEARIDRAFFVDLFLAISNMEGVQPRNIFELTQRNQERLLQLGPVLERTFGEFLTPMVNRTFNQMLRASMNSRGEWLSQAVIPPPPDVLQGRQLRPRFVSSLAMAQQAVSTGNIDRFTAFVGGLVGTNLSDGLKLDADQAMDEYGLLIGVPPRIVRPDEQVAEMRAQRQQQETMAANMEMTKGMADAAKTATDAKLTDDSVGKRLVQQVTGR